MTEDAKINLLKYLTHSVENASYGDELTVYNDLNINMGDFSTADYTVDKIMGVLPAKDIINDIDLLLYYGYGTKTGNGHVTGCIIYCDKNNNFLQLVNTFASGSEMFMIYDLKINEENQMYAIAYDGQEAAGVIHTRLLLLDNIAQKNQLTNKYEVKLRISYRMQGTNYAEGSSVDPQYTRVVKDNNSASYLIYYRYISLLYMTRFKIVFGGSNEWEDYTTGANYLRSNLSVEWVEEVPHITVLERDTIMREQINKYYITSPSSTTTTSIDFSADIQAIIGIDETTVQSTISMVNDAYAYINFISLVPFEHAVEWVELTTFRLDYSGEVITNTYHYTVGATVMGAVQTFNTYVNNNTQVIIVSYVNDATNGLDLFICITNHDKGYEVYYYYNYDMNSSDYDFFPVLYNIYNLSYITIMARETSTGDCTANNFKFMYAEDTYSGKPVYDEYSLLADKVSLYDSNDDLIFNRDISNIVVQGNTVTTTVNVPNIYLNNTSISKENLLSKNNNIINDSSTVIDKNIYENLFVNFINTVTIQDQNTDTYVYNPVGANRLANSAFYTVDYSAASMTKYRIKYSDNSSYVGSIDDSQIDYDGSSGIYVNGKFIKYTKNATYNFAVYITKAAKELQLISNDESTVYQTIDISNLSVGLYSISQHVYIQ